MMTRPHLRPPPQFSPRGLLAVTMIVAAVLLLFAILPVRAQPAGLPVVCQPPDAVIERLAATHPVEKMIPLNDEQAARVSSWWDAQPPVSEDHFDLAIVLKHTQHETGLLLGRDGKVCKAVLIPDDVMPALLAAIMGTGASLPLILVQSHRPQDMEIHDKFYSNWMVPNRGNPRTSSCCSNVDCAPADIKRMSGHWYGHRDGDRDWILIPDALIESNQGDPKDSPDGRSHICVNTGGTVLCAVLGSGQ